MKTGLKLSVIIFLLFVTISSYSQDYKVRMAFIGNSITIGSGLANPTRDCYPSQLAVMMKEKYGDTVVVTNYAVSGRTLLKHGDFPIWNEADFTRCWNYAPDILFISLGTNDSKPYNWDDYSQEFYSDYKALIDTFKLRNPAVKFIVCSPPPAFAVVWDIRNTVILNEVIPLVDSIVKTTGAELVDFYHPLLDSVSLFPDKIHPDPRGAKAMASIAFDKIVSSDIIHKVETGHAFVTSFKSNIAAELRKNDPATLTWTSINATEAFLDGEQVETNGSIKVAPVETTKYTLVVKAEFSSDSLVFVQKVYIPELKKISASVSSRSIDQGDTSKIKLNCYDQNNKIITDSVFSVNWSITEGYGRFVNEGINYVEFVGDSAGTTNILCEIRSISYKTSITINKKLTSTELRKVDEVPGLYPNPFSKSVYVYIPVNETGKPDIKIFDAGGRLCLSESSKLRATGKQPFELNTSGLSKGIYFYNLEFSGKSYSGKLIKE